MILVILIFLFINFFAFIFYCLSIFSFRFICFILGSLPCLCLCVLCLCFAPRLCVPWSCSVLPLVSPWLLDRYGLSRHSGHLLCSFQGLHYPFPCPLFSSSASQSVTICGQWSMALGCSTAPLFITNWTVHHFTPVKLP